MYVTTYMSSLKASVLWCTYTESARPNLQKRRKTVVKLRCVRKSIVIGFSGKVDKKFRTPDVERAFRGVFLVLKISF